jgi:hypothetical protein
VASPLEILKKSKILLKKSEILFASLPFFLE